MTRHALFDPPSRARVARSHALLWLFDALEDDPGYLRRKMFGCEAAYLDGRQCLVLADREPPWNGLLICTDHSYQASLTAQFPALRPHPVLGKWLYLPEDDPDFESQAGALVQLARARDARIGVASRPRRTRLKP